MRGMYWCSYEFMRTRVRCVRVHDIHALLDYSISYISNINMATAHNAPARSRAMFCYCEFDCVFFWHNLELRISKKQCEYIRIKVIRKFYTSIQHFLNFFFRLNTWQRVTYREAGIRSARIIDGKHALL